ncbi:MAG: S8 family serine peptidase [Verrucomicrobiales bacterium]
MTRSVYLSHRGGQLRLGLVAWLALGSAAWAQQGSRVRYYIRSGQVSPAAYASLYDKVTTATEDTDDRTGIVARLYYDWADLCAVAAVMRPDQMQRLLDDPALEVALDLALRPVSTTAGPNWPLNQWVVPENIEPCIQTAPVVYLVDTGVAVDHTDFDYAPGADFLSFLPGISFGFDYTKMPPARIPANTDPNDHGTRVAGCLGGRTSGLLGPLGGRAQVRSILIYDVDPALPLVTYVSQAIQGILAAVADHSTRRAQPYLKNHASVLVFPHSTTAAAGRLADLDQTLEVAWLEGLHVILAAGNEGAPAVEVSPAGAAWGYVDGGNSTRFFFGAKPPTATWFRAEEEFLTVGGYRDTGGGALALSTLTNLNILGAEAIDVFAPGEAVTCPSAANPTAFVSGSGTSLAAGFTAALAAWSTFERPWARPSQVRAAVRAAATTDFGFPKAETPGLASALTYRQWIDHFFPEASSSQAERDPMGDPDGDAVPSFVEFHCGQDPRFRDAEIRPEILLSPSPSSSTITVTMPIACHLGSARQVTWQLETSTDLATWTALPTGALAPVDPLVIEGDGTRSKADAVGPSAPPGAGWFRIRFSAGGPLL